MLDAAIEAIGLALTGRAGARLAARLGIAVGRDTLLRRCVQFRIGRSDDTGSGYR